MVKQELTMYDHTYKVDASIYWNLDESMIYFADIRPYLLFAVRAVSRSMSNLSKLRFIASKRTLKYLERHKELWHHKIYSPVALTVNKQDVLMTSSEL